MNILPFSKHVHENVSFKHANAQGFLLIELMVSLVIFMFLTFIMHQYLAKSLLLASDAHKRYEALTILDSFIVDIQRDSAVLQKKKLVKNGITLTWVQEPFLFTQNFAGKALSTECKKITITACYNQGNQIAVTTGI